jgi:hypothetical protein
MPEINECMVKDVTEGKITCKHPQWDLYKVLDTMPKEINPISSSCSRELESVSEGVNDGGQKEKYKY